jgi:hypothetical protein
MLCVEPCATVAHNDFNRFGRSDERDLDGLRFILLIAMQDRVCHGFAHSHVNAESGFIANLYALDDRRRSSGSIGNGLNAARQYEFSRLFGHYSRYGLSMSHPGGLGYKNRIRKANRKNGRFNTPATRMSRRPKEAEDGGNLKALTFDLRFPSFRLHAPS